jgi:TolA-binding protein
MGLARAARLAGRLDISKAALLSCRRRFAGTQDAAMAAYLLGRSAAAAEAARWFATYLTEQPNGPLAREANGRLMEAQFGSGQREAARAQARAYLLRYPAGPHADFAHMVLRQ